MNHPSCVCGDALETKNARLREALKNIIAIHEGWTDTSMNYGARGDETKRIARDALAAADEGEK